MEEGDECTECHRYREFMARIIVEPNRAAYLAYIALNDPENAVVVEEIATHGRRAQLGQFAAKVEQRERL